MKYCKWMAMALLALLSVSCEKEQLRNGRDITFSASIEQMDNSDSKIILSREQWIYWELGDEISIGTELSSGQAQIGYLVNASPGDFEDFSGVFVATLPEWSKYFLGLHPYDERNIINGRGEGRTDFDNPTLFLPTEQPLRNDTTFSRRILPMVAVYTDEWSDENPNPFNLDFHNLSGLVRVQLFNSSGSDVTVDSLIFKSRNDTKLSGQFTVTDFATAEPKLTGGSIDSVKITCGDGLEIEQGSLRTFYLVLPARVTRNETFNYSLSMTVYSNQGKFSKNFSVPVRRCGITNMRAIGISNWESGTASTGLAGNGTKTRPFKVYTLADLQYLRDCYNSGENPRRINGQEITANTYITLMRSDIVLGTADWEPIRSFVGHLSAVSGSSTPGITNNSNYPLFSKIEAGSVVEGITVKSDAHYTTPGSGKSPFCTENNGTIENCVVTSQTGTGIVSDIDAVAGLVVENKASGRIIGCNCRAKLTTLEDYSIAGICLENSGTIQGCQTTSDMSVTTASGQYTKVAGICLTNTGTGTVENSYFSSIISGSTAQWGGIVYDNKGTVNNCYFGGSGTIVTTGQIGAIVHTNSGTVNYCRINGKVTGVRAAGIVDSLTAGHVINCYADAGQVILSDATGTARIAGGLVAVMTGGRIENSYARKVSVQHSSSSDVKGGIVGTITGGNVENCYSYVANAGLFYGSTTYTNVEIVDNHVFTRCYLVSGNQTGTFSITTSSAAASSGEENALVDALNAANQPSGSYSWLLPTGSSAPVLDNH